ncbi:magnesium-translocating P-type ATPase [Chryseotalea sanaruensis]|uniref:Magnesium-transporting ATPase, P-type 1 n=1 Tax=Chryseotalea sanaruensis TaxID=2482724 RepID=A0A401U689_9BACT|nr:magnesium-translocating P-type ATPase [Chryseotalea sanaruensis]GCC50372.1 magnesium-translocating P-type ATPase [Chryseotalea sanaruensis]
MNKSFPYWSISLSELIKDLDTTILGISDEKASDRNNKSMITPMQSILVSDIRLLLTQFKSPLVLLLIFAVILSAILGEYTNTFIILGIIFLSALLGFWQERKANHALRKLRDMVQVKATVLRNNIEKDIPASQVVYGDVILLNAGDIIPADCIIVESNDLHISEASLTGESFPVEKEIGLMPIDTPLSKRKNCVFKGTNVINGTAKVLAVYTNSKTEFGKISGALSWHEPETAFEKGIKKFGYMIMQITMILSIIIFIINIYLGKNVIDSILFALALAVGMTPELLPAIITITLSAGAKRLVDKKVIVKKLSAIQNLGAVNVFCSDKTGTLTEGKISVQYTVDSNDNDWPRIKTFAYLNSRFETGFTNPMDEAIRNLTDIDIDGYQKVDEVPYDFIRKRLSIAVAFQGMHLLITKGALKNILEVCDSVELASGNRLPLNQMRNKIITIHEKYSRQGFRTIGLCYKDITGDPLINKKDERDMTFLGLVILADTIKPGIANIIHELKSSGVTLKLITGDNQLAAAFVGKKIGLQSENVLTGGELRKMSEEALAIKVNEIDVFAEIEPNQKERLVRALQKSGNVVSFIGDGINDVSALKTADVGITVDNAVDIAKETADIVLMEKNLEVLQEGILEGRKTFINTLKYIFITTSANFGNMFSVAGTSLFLPFLPLLPKQILLLNFLSDLPAMTIASDKVDAELLNKPRKWNAMLIRKFMIVFGIESSLFDFLTFGTLLWLFKANIEQFQTGWFIESCITEILILLVIRTQRSSFKSKPGKYLIYMSIIVSIGITTLPYFCFSSLMGFTPLPITIFIGMVGIAFLYAFIAEITKRIFFRRVSL